MEAADLSAAGSLMTAALNFFEAASQMSNADVKLVVSVCPSQAVLCKGSESEPHATKVVGPMT